MAAEQPPVDVEFFLDPVCPWCWITSRWVTHVQDETDYTVGWRFISLYVLNEDKEPSEQMRQAHLAGLRALRVADQVRIDHGNDAVAALYTELGTRIHVEGRRDDFAGDTESFIAEALTAAGLDPGLAAHSHDESHDAYLREEIALALSRDRPQRRHADPDVRPRPGRARGQLLRTGHLQGAPWRRGGQAVGGRRDARHVRRRRAQALAARQARVRLAPRSGQDPADVTLSGRSCRWYAYR